MYYLIIFLLFNAIIAMETDQNVELIKKKQALFKALRLNQFKDVKRIIQELPPDELKNSSTPWAYEAVPYGLPMVEQFVEAGASVNSTNSKDGWSPLMLAASVNDAQIVLYLLKKGADVNQTASDGSAPLLEAQKNQLSKIQEILIKHKEKIGSE